MWKVQLGPPSGLPLLPMNFPLCLFSPRPPWGVPLPCVSPRIPCLHPWEDWDLAVGSSPVTVPSAPADYTLCNTVRLALAAGLLLLLGLITAEAARSRCCRGWRSRLLPAGSAAPPGTAAGPPRLFPSSNPRWDK